jgi:hypothetical protein
MCPLCIASGTLALATAGSAGGLGALAAKILQTRRGRVDQGGGNRQAAAQPDDFPATQKANAGSVARSGIVPAKAA